MDHPTLTRRAWLRYGAAGLGAAVALRASAQVPLTRPASCGPFRRRAIVWQPWASHAQLSVADWRQLGEVAQHEGYVRVLVQWSRFGDTEFWPASGPRWLEDGLAHWRDLPLRLIMGLYMGQDYYQVLAQSDPALRAHMLLCRDHSLEQAQRLLSHPPALPVDGWYLPQEIDDLNWRRATRERMLRTYLGAMRDGLARLAPGRAELPVYVSAFFSGASTPGNFASLLARLHRDTGVVWVVQGGMGTHRLSDARTAAYLRAISNTLPETAWVGLLEVFDQQPASGAAPATFEPSTDAEVEQRRALWCASTGRQPEMTFSLNQRVVAARAAPPKR